MGVSWPAEAYRNCSNLKHLVINPKEVVEVLIVNCPKLGTLETCMIRDLRVNGMLFQEISYAVQHLTMQRGRTVTVIRLEWDDAVYSISEERCNFSAERFLEIVSTFKALKELSIPTWSLVATVKEMIALIPKLLYTLPNLEIIVLKDGIKG
jgi:hypothetical protein